MSDGEGKDAGEAGAGTDAEVKSFSEAEFNARLEKETSGLKAKVDELLGEKKTISTKAKEDAAAREAERDRQAKESNDFKSLFESSESKRAELSDKLAALESANRDREIGGSANKLANEMASGHNVSIMETMIKSRLGLGEDGNLLVLSEEGNPTVATLSDLKKEFVASGRFDSLIDATKATGGGAAKPNTGGAGTGKKLSDMSRTQKLEYFKNKRSA
jgi:hypothetical protein